MTTTDGGLAAPAGGDLRARDPHPIEIAFAEYDRTRPIIDGRVRPAGIALNVNTSWVGDFCRRPVYEDYDAAEMSLSWYVAARDRGEPVIALPVFLLRMPVLAYVYVRSDSTLTKPADLVGKRIGSRGYRQTVNLWLRGIFKEYYGLAPEQATWVTSGPEDAGYVVPEDVHVEIREGSDATENLRDGEVDALFCTSVPKAFVDGQPWIRRLLPDAQGEMQAFVRRTGIMPLTHALVMRRELAEREPWIAESLFRAFVEAQRLADEICQDNVKRLSLFDSVFILEKQRAAYGASPYIHGIEPNRKTIEAFVRYAHDQGYISRAIPVEELFAPNTLAL